MNIEARSHEQEKNPMNTARQRKKEAGRAAAVRRILQAVFFFTMPGAFSAGFSGAKYIFTQIGQGAPIEWNSFLLVLTALCVFTVLFGRFFCGCVCAFGSLGDLVFAFSGLIQKKVLKRKKQISISEKFSLILQKTKYFLLAAILLLCLLGVYSKYSGYDPWSVFSLITAFRFDTKDYPGTIVLIAVVIGMAFKERFFCQFLCPLGAIFSLLPVLPFSYFRRNEKNCIKGCGICKQNCPVDIRLEQDGFRNGECISCSRCMGVCPRGNLTRWDKKLFRKEAVSMLIKGGIFFIIGLSIGVFRFL